MQNVRKIPPILGKFQAKKFQNSKMYEKGKILRKIPKNLFTNLRKISKFSPKARHQKYEKFLYVHKIPKKMHIMYVKFHWNLIPRTP